MGLTRATGNGNTTGEAPIHRGPTQRGGPRRGPTTGGDGNTGDPHRTHTDRMSLVVERVCRVLCGCVIVCLCILFFLGGLVCVT